MQQLKTFILVCLVSMPAFAQWVRTNGPEGISISSLVTINDKIYAGTVTDGLYVSSNNGDTWIPRNTGIESLEVTDIMSYQGYLYVATFGHGVFRSIDEGVTWIPSSNNNNAFIESLVAKDNYLFAGTSSDGVYRSSDFGDTWTQLFSYIGIEAMCVTDTRVFAASYGYTYYSTDNGNNWSSVYTLEGAGVWSFYTSGDTIIVGCVNEIYRSTNGGNTFYQFSLGVPYSITNVYSLTRLGSVLFAGTSYYGVLKSSDLGTSWSIANSGMGPKDVRAVTANSSSLFAGSHYVGVYKSTNMGTEWNKSMEGFPAGSSITSMLFAQGYVFVGTRDGVFRTSDSGNSWIDLPGTNDTINYGTVRGLCEKDGIIYAGVTLQFNSTVYKSTDRGETWVRSGNGLPGNLTFINSLASSGNNIIAATDEGMYYSSDNGDNWYVSGFPVDFVEDMSASDGHVYAIRQFVGIYRSDDDGVNWYLILNAVADHISMAAYNSHVYVGSFFNACIYSPNYGNSWFESYGFPPESAVFGFGTVDDNMVLAGTDVSSSYIYSSTDGGSNFFPYSEGLGPNAVTEFLTASDTFMFAGTDYNGVWRRLQPGVPVELASFKASLVDNKVRLDWKTATETNNKGFEIQRKESESINKNSIWKNIRFVQGFGTTTEYHTYSFTDNENLTGKLEYRLKQIDFNGSYEYSDVVEINVNVHLGFSLEQNYPNPFNPSTRIKYTIPESGSIEKLVLLKVYDVLGNEVATLVNEPQHAGEYEVVFEGRNLSSGVYFYTLRSENYSSTRKLIFLR